jgi:hypothetical protein
MLLKVQQHGLNATIEVISNGVLLDTFKDSVPAEKTVFLKSNVVLKSLFKLPVLKSQRSKNSNSVTHIFIK